MSNKLKLLLVFCVLLLSCKKHQDNCIPVTSNFFQGNWNYDKAITNLGGTNYTFTFQNDSFKMNIFTVTDLVLVPCNYINSWSEYTKGTWLYKNDSLIFNGFYCDEDYNILDSSTCPQVIDTGAFYKEFNNVYYCNDTLVFQNTFTYDLIKLKRN